MHKVVVERPRWNPGPGKHGRRANRPAELLPKFEGIKRPHVQRKGLTDLLGPLKRWLHSQVGRPWNDVYSEACAVIKPDSIVRAHIKTHLLEFVERHTFMHDGSVCVLDTWRGGGIRPVTAKRFGRSAFYVHPETGLLREIKPVSRRDWQRAQREKRQQTFRWLDDRSALKQINGIWFACQFREIPPDGPFKAYDHALGQFVGRGGLVRREGVYLHCIAKRQLSRRELRKFGLSNTTLIINQPERSLQQATRGLLTIALRLFSDGTNEVNPTRYQTGRLHETTIQARPPTVSVADHVLRQLVLCCIIPLADQLRRRPAKPQRLRFQHGIPAFGFRVLARRAILSGIGVERHTHGGRPQGPSKPE